MLTIDILVDLFYSMSLQLFNTVVIILCLIFAYLILIVLFYGNYYKY